jgi:alpha-L-fucosidase
MNIPPDKEGLINKADIKNLKEWKTLRDEIFENNLAKGAVIFSSNGTGSQTIFDKNYATYWTTKGKDSCAVIELQLKNKTTFNGLMLQENITIGQRIENFELQYFDGKRWQNAAEGTTVGYKRLLQFNPVTTNKVRRGVETIRQLLPVSNFIEGGGGYTLRLLYSLKRGQPQNIPSEMFKVEKQ